MDMGKSKQKYQLLTHEANYNLVMKDGPGQVHINGQTA